MGRRQRPYGRPPTSIEGEGWGRVVGGAKFGGGGARPVIYFSTHPDMTGQIVAANWVDGRPRYHFVDVAVSERELVVG